MKFGTSALALCVFLAACGSGTPFNGETDDTDGSTDGGAGSTSREGLPPGTENPTPDSDITRTEPEDENGNGQAEGYTYNAGDDTFTVDGLAFDGNNVYARGTQVADLGPYAVYEAAETVNDSQTGQPIQQFAHRAIYGVSKNTDASGTPKTQFAIVRTGQYADYGFGGFIYKRAGGVTLESAEGAQGIYTGSTAGIRDFSGAGGMQYTTGTLTVQVDFGDFNDADGSVGDGVSGRLSDRRIYDVSGRDVTSDVVANINAENDSSLTSLPAALFEVGPGVLDANGEIIGSINSSFVNNEGDTVAYESGNYYAVMAGDDSQEIVGVLVLENTAEAQGVTARDTSGFIIYRDPTPVTP
ncbi:hypothetical protein DSM110277_01283 [Sulfitobacter pontiacus]|jgi:hypothetical protein|uniref:Transferrin-binding protein B C-lobe/N-lobe beta barrel domain-containing protein n=1 Tax=Sulfitobacter pontiacus TaxID=60137 RepID=A0AAX3A9D8_9RHOB|nr:hypothetical protein [Sulfitobacter pontiacus]UOA22875.1 hypothetical protein DSM110277_01283 [Sulfitobacter pontiacus]WPZ26665.1 hypothetical protein UM399_06625 [Sulfitobacter pontiacus]